VLDKINDKNTSIPALNQGPSPHRIHHRAKKKARFLGEAGLFLFLFQKN
jgi:hypothetical protein